MPEESLPIFVRLGESMIGDQHSIAWKDEVWTCVLAIPPWIGPECSVEPALLAG